MYKKKESVVGAKKQKRKQQHWRCDRVMAQQTPEQAKATARQVALAVVIAPSSIKEAGLGAFWGGNTPIPHSSTLGWYNGDKLTKNELAQRYPGPVKPRYVLEIEEGVTWVDASEGSAKSNWTRYINHSRKNANCMYSAEGQMITVRTVQVGDEFLANYGSSYNFF